MQSVQALGNYNHMHVKAINDKIRAAPKASKPDSKPKKEASNDKSTESKQTAMNLKTQIIISNMAKKFDNPNVHIDNPNAHTVPVDIWKQELSNAVVSPKIKFLLNEQQTIEILEVISQQKYFENTLIGKNIDKSGIRRLSLKYIVDDIQQNIFCFVGTVGVVSITGYRSLALFHTNGIDLLTGAGLFGGISLFVAGFIGKIYKDVVQLNAALLNETFDSICQKQNIQQSPLTTLYLAPHNGDNQDASTVLNLEYGDFRNEFRQMIKDNGALFNVSKSNPSYADAMSIFTWRKQEQNEPIILSDKLAWPITFARARNMILNMNAPETSQVNTNYALKLVIGSLFPAVIAGSCGVPLVALPVIMAGFPAITAMLHRNKMARMIRYYMQQKRTGPK